MFKKFLFKLKKRKSVQRSTIDGQNWRRRQNFRSRRKTKIRLKGSLLKKRKFENRTKIVKIFRLKSLKIDGQKVAVKMTSLTRKKFVQSDVVFVKRSLKWRKNENRGRKNENSKIGQKFWKKTKIVFQVDVVIGT